MWLAQLAPHLQNFPEAAYSGAMPALAAHTPDQVVEAIRRDAQLALTRGSRYRGVRRVGGTGRAAAFEARLPPRREGGEAAVAAGLAGVPAGLAPPGAEQCVQLPGLQEGAPSTLPGPLVGTQQQQWLQGGAQTMALDQQLPALSAQAVAQEALPA